MSDAGASHGVAVVVPVFNAAAELAACLASLERTLPAGIPVLIADDASPAPQVAAVSRAFCEHRGGDARYVRRDENLGFIANVNRAFVEAGDRDVVLLNSDTVTSTGWLARMTECLASDPAIATVTPWSNNAEICSFPRFCEINPVPDDVDVVAAAAASLAPDYVELPTAVGFCMLIRRRALEQLGNFDAATFGRGYGEENDFCLRARGHGWRNVLCNTAYVAHAGGASFAPAGLAPGGENLRRLNARYPGYNPTIAAFILSDPLRGARDAFAAALAAATPESPQADLFDRPT